MALLREKHCEITMKVFIFLLFSVQISVETSNDFYHVHGHTLNDAEYIGIFLDTHRTRRDVAASPAAHLEPSPANLTVPTAPANATTPLSHDSSTKATSVPPTYTSNISNVGVNGSGIRKDPIKLPKVSDPIVDDGSNNTALDVFKETPEMIKAEHHLSNLTYVNHTFYNSTFIGNPEYFKAHWLNITSPKAEVHVILSSSHRRATTVTLGFEFPFYGQPLGNITVATGGFIYTGDHVHNWLAATQYIAPLMANFDTTLTNDSAVKLSDDGTKFTVIWENVTLQGNANKTFTFAVTLYKDGDIVFAYKDIPIPIQSLEDVSHPVKVGISDAYLTDRVLFYIRRKTIYEYHRVDFRDHNITSGTVLRLHALPTCLLYSTCKDCINHKTSFNCSWCSNTQRCSSGIDRKKQDWLLRNCDKNPIVNESDCTAIQANATATKTGEPTSYVPGNKNNPYHDVIIRHDYDRATPTPALVNPSVNRVAAPVTAPDTERHSSLNGLVAAFVTVVMVAVIAAWVLYAYKNPHTRSGQLLIKYRPSAWSWKRGEARYTAATIHM